MKYGKFWRRGRYGPELCLVLFTAATAFVLYLLFRWRCVWIPCIFVCVLAMTALKYLCRKIASVGDIIVEVAYACELVLSIFAGICICKNFSQEISLPLMFTLFPLLAVVILSATLLLHNFREKAEKDASKAEEDDYVE